MIIKTVKVQNFGCIQTAELSLDALTALVGANGSGKSTILRAVDLFYSQSPRIGPEDFYARDTGREIEIAVTFTKLENEARTKFQNYLEGNELTVVRVFSVNEPKGKYHGSRLQNPDFASFRAGNSANEQKAAYNELLEGAYKELPPYKNQKDADAALRNWETNNPTGTIRARDDGQFFGYEGVGSGYISKYTRFVIIPAVREASEDASDGRGSVIAILMDLVVRKVLASRADLVNLRQETQEKYNSIVDPKRLEELGTLADSLSKTLKTYTPEAGIALNWIAGAGIEIPMPKADVRLTEDGNESPVNRTGHGLQRALVLTLLQHLAVARGVEPEKKDGQEPPASGENLAAATMPDLLLAIEEPELYQHPNRQRHFAQVLMDLATGDIPGVAQRTQVLYCTHSPLFVGIDRLNQLRLLRKQSADASKPKTTKLIQASLDQVADELWVAQGKPGEQWTGETLRPRLQAIMTPWMNEGFFADVVVLVEGEEDRAAILAQAASAGLQLEREGIAVIPCMGKNSIDRPLLIFRHLKIPTYVVWDADYTPKNPDPKANRSLFRLLSHPVEDWPTQNIVTDRFACFRENLDEALRDEGEIGRTLFDDLLRDICDDLEITRQADGRKNPFVMKRLILRASGQGRKSKTLEQIVSKIRLLKGPEPRAS